MARLLKMPEVAAGTTEAVVAEWPVTEQGSFAAGDPVVTVETEKAVVDVPADADGVLLRVLVAAGSTVEVGEVIALVGEPGEQVDDVDALLAQLGAGAPDSGADAPLAGAEDGVDGGLTDRADDGAPQPEPVTPQVLSNGAATGGGRVFSSPLARRLAREAGLDVESLHGTGPNGRIVRRDVQGAVAARAAEPAAPVAAQAPQPEPSPVAQAPHPATGYEDVPHTRLRRTVAARLTQSVTQAPHFFVEGSARVDALLALRAELNAGGGTKVSVNDLVVAAVARAHVAVPDLNVTWGDDAVRRFTSVDVAVAVATDRGLVTPVLRGVDQRTIGSIAAANADLVTRARAGRLRQDELEGGTVTVSNLGGYGVERFSAIINPPHASILAVGAARQEPVVVDGQLDVATVLHVTLSVDHRPVDGATAAQWVQVFTDLLEHPLRVLA
ncbi:dihydrolipoamide acetyltransferase family protein [Angustibacter aerolatus]